MAVDYEANAAAQVEYVRVRLNWDINAPLRFQRHFQFTPGVNSLLRFRYERLRGFCEVCGMLTHDSGNCQIQNGGGEEPSDGDNDDENPIPQRTHNNNGIQIRELNNDELYDAEMEQEMGPTQNGYEGIEAIQDESSVTLEKDSKGKQIIASEASVIKEKDTPIAIKFMDTGASSSSSRKRKHTTEEEVANKEQASNKGESSDSGSGNSALTPVRGAVGPKPHLPP